MSPSLRFPTPRSFLHLVSLRTAAEFITLTLLLNKVPGFYGILAIFTGYHLNPLQLSHYIYSLLVLVLAAWFGLAIKRPSAQNPLTRTAVLKNVALAWIYLIDTLVNGAYTTLFGMGWFVLLAQQQAGDGSTVQPFPGTGKGTMDETAGFTSPQVNASSVDVVAQPKAGLLSGQDAVAYLSTTPGGAFGASVLQSDSIASIALLGIFWLVRVYFCIVMLAYARSVLRQYIASTSASSTAPFPTTSADASMADSPFAATEGAGWSSALGRAMLRFPSQWYWLGREDAGPGAGANEWERATSGRFEGGNGRKVLHIRVPSERDGSGGVAERERRARSGTGPPAKVVPQ